MSFIYLLPIEPVGGEVFEFIGDCLYEAFRIRTKTSSRKIDASVAYDEMRDQYNSSKLLAEVIKYPPPDALRIIAVTDVDLFVPIFTFHFGQAQLDGLGAIVSTHRLHNRFYGLPEDKRLFRERVDKEAVHELGHTFGLTHCMDPFCVMRSSTYVEDVDQKSIDFCNRCRRLLSEKLKSIR